MPAFRPLVSDGAAKTGADSYNVSRRAELVDHGRRGLIDGLFRRWAANTRPPATWRKPSLTRLVKKLGRKTAPPAPPPKQRFPGAGLTVSMIMVRGYQKTWPGHFQPCVISPICWRAAAEALRA